MVKKIRTTPQRGGKAKRWFAEASGWGLKVSLGSGDAKLGKRGASLPEASNYTVVQTNLASVNFAHNTLVTANVFAPITQGTTQNNRIGNSIFVRDVYASFMFDSSTATNTSSAYVVRILLVELTQQYATTAFGAGVGATDLFISTTVPMAIARIDPRLAMVVCDEVIEIQPKVGQTVGSGSLGNVAITTVGCKFNRSFEYRAATVYGTASNYYWVVVPYTSGGVNGVTLCGGMSVDTVVTYDS